VKKRVGVHRVFECDDIDPVQEGACVGMDEKEAAAQGSVCSGE